MAGRAKEPEERRKVGGDLVVIVGGGVVDKVDGKGDAGVVWF
jgi:hypothetical protein